MMGERLTKNFQSDEKLREFLKQIETTVVFIRVLSRRESDDPKTVCALLSLLRDAEDWLNALPEPSGAALVREYINVAKQEIGERVTTQAWWTAHRALGAAASYLKSQTNGELLPGSS